MRVEEETVKSAVEAYAEGRIELPEVPDSVQPSHRRYAPGYAVGGGGAGQRHPYTATTLAQFLGWSNKRPSSGRIRPSKAVEVALSALEMIEAGVLEEDLPFGGRSAQMMMAVSQDERLADPKRVSDLPPGARAGRVGCDAWS